MGLQKICIRGKGEIKDDPKVSYVMVEGVRRCQITEKKWEIWKVKEMINLFYHPLSFSAKPCP